MPINETLKTNFLYRFEAGSSVYLYTNIAEDQTYNDETYSFIPIEHEAPTFSGEPQDSEIDITIDEVNPIADLFVTAPPAYPVTVKILDYDRATGIATDYYKGWIVRSSYALIGSKVAFHAKTLWHFFERDSLSDSLSALSRYSIFDPRAGVDIAPLRVGITVTVLNEFRDVLTVTGITDLDGWFTGGVIIAPDGDERTIILHETVGPDVQLTLNGAFPQFVLDVGFPADIYPGDDLTYNTWANKFSTVTNNGEAFGGWPYMPNVDPLLRGVI